jgi:flagella basal body P-ring formation protein FlgA
MKNQPSRIRRSIPAGFGGLALLWGAMACAAPPPPPDKDLQDTAVLESLARAEAGRHLPQMTEQQRLAVTPIHGGQTLTRCLGPVQSSVAPGIQVSGRILIELHCEVGNHWHIYVPVRVVGTSPAVVTAHAIVAGSTLAKGDLVVELHDMTELPPGYLNSTDIAIGMTASRAIAGGAILTNQELLGNKAVQRGQAVTLVAGNGDVSVRMAGKALSDGFINQRIRVENLSSGKIVEGIARSEQVVEIVFQ